MRSARFWTFAVTLFAAASVLAAQAGLTGNDYLKMSKPQRVKTVRMFKEEAAKQGVTIKKDPVFYCEKLDALYVKNPDMKNEQFVKVVKTLAIMEYDWDQRGVDKDVLAKQWLGSDLYNANKARVGARK
jgi:hypothetical protein